MAAAIDDRVAELERANGELRRQLDACGAELKEARDQQTATVEVLQVINSSPGDLAPVFDAILEKATNLCEAQTGVLWTYHGEEMQPAAILGAAPGYEEYLRQGLRPLSPNHAHLSRGAALVHLPDIPADPVYAASELARALVELGGIRTILMVPMRKDSATLGAFCIYRKEPRPFTDNQIALLQNFAAQAVIAMENARLLGETREALEQQTATADVLQVINSSSGDLAPVFDAVLDKATRFCDAAFGTLWTYDGERFHAVALRQVPEAYAEFLSQAPLRPVPFSGLGRVAAGESVAHFVDVAVNEAYAAGDPALRALLELGKARSTVAVPLRKDNTVLGAITAYRNEVRPFSDKQIALLQNFAAQAVIAMENARLLTETREALEQQTATAEVLGVINSSPGDLAPVFDAILDKAHSLCDVAHGSLQFYDGVSLRAVATHGVSDAFADILRHGYRAADSPAGRGLIEGRRFVQIADCAEIDHPVFQSAAELAGIRTVLFVPLRRDDALLGLISSARREVRPFSDKEIALLQNFAAQAVIAMENARLLTETREALEQQTAAAEVLQVINSSPGDLAPVFDAMLDRALRLCNAAYGNLLSYDGDRLHPVAVRGDPRLTDWLPRHGSFRPGPGTTNFRIIRGEVIVHVADAIDDEPYRQGDPIRRSLVEIGQCRALLSVALRKDDALLGVIHVYRTEPHPFSEKQIGLLQNFAAQAVIAMENARLITETREALEQQTATADVLQVINSSPGDLTPVFDAMLEKALRLCEAAFGLLHTYDGERFHALTVGGMSRAAAEPLLEWVPDPGSALERIVRGDRVVHIPDVVDTEAYRSGVTSRLKLVELTGARTALWVALRKDDALLGVFVIYRQEVRPFSDKQIALLQNFAAQAVIAMENARLITELRQRTSDLEESLEYQTATSDVLRVISGSVFDLEPVLQTVLSRATDLCRSPVAEIFRLHDGGYRWAAGLGVEPEYEEIERRSVIQPGQDTLVGRVALERRMFHVADVLEDPLYGPKQEARLGKFRTMLGVPLLRDDMVIGVIAIARWIVEPYTDKEIRLVTTFADQAVIAIENARLLGKLRERTAELGRSVDELRLLSEVGQAVSSTLDLRAVLSTVLGRSVGLTGADAGAVFRYIRAERSFRLVEAFGWDEALLRSVGDLHVPEAETAMGEAAARRVPIQLADLADRPSAALRDASLAAGFRGVLIVPLVGPERILGALVLQRRAAGEFPAETVRLMQTLASQSVLAIQNARLFREIADKSEQLALASEHKSQFLANMSHELRTPLNAILGYAELLVDGIYGVLPEKAQGVLERVQNNGKHLLALINDVLDLAKIEAGQLTLTLEDYVLSDVVRSVVTVTEPLAAAKGLKFAATVEDGVPKAYGDARRVSQVLLNLVGNAIKFTDAGEIEIRAAAVDGQFVLTVRDTGPGIADADQERIFGEFQQIENTDTRRKGGTGLGLAISKRMVEMQGGMISVGSAPGRGSTFRVVLPVRVEAMSEAAE